MRPPSARRAEIQRLDLRVDAVPDAVPEVREAVTAFAARTRRGDPADVALAVTEAATNAVLHAYRGEDGGEMRVVACARPADLLLVVRDYGCGMRPNPDSPGLGLGLALMGRLATEMNVERPDDGGTRLRMRFR